MDPFLLVIWIIRLLFLALLYLFLARVVGSLLRDLRAAAREPGASAIVEISASTSPTRRSTTASLIAFFESKNR